MLWIFPSGLLRQWRSLGESDRTVKNVARQISSSAKSSLPPNDTTIRACSPSAPRDKPWDFTEGQGKALAEQVLKDIRRQTRRQYSAEEKIRIVLKGLRGKENISELCRREGISASMYYG